MTFAPIAPTTYVPPTQDRGGHVRDPSGAARARAAAVRLPQLDGDPRQGAGDRRHRHAGEPRAVARGRVLARRAEGRALDLPVARRRRPHRQPRRGDDGVPERASSCATGRWSSGTRTASTSRSTAAGGSWTASRSTSATARCRRCGRRCSTRRRRAGCSTRRPACTGRSTRSRRRCPIRRWAIADLDPDFWDFGMCAVRARRGEPVAHDARPRRSTAATSTACRTSTSRRSPRATAR